MSENEDIHALFLIIYVFCCSSAQLLEPFRLNHDIQLLSGGNILSGGSGIGDLDRAPGAPTPMMHSNVVIGPNTELEDPPGLYEKVGRLFIVQRLH